MDFILIIASDYLIETMSAVFIIALILRFMAYRANKKDQLYYSTFTREIEKRVERDDIGKIELDDIEVYIEGLLEDVSKSLPSRGVRVMKTNKEASPGRKIMSVREYAGGSQSLVHSLKSETNAFKAKQKPNFDQLTHRVMSKDAHWMKLHNVLPIEGVIRVIDVLPGIFIVIGIFGTFVGITNALPRIANIDFNNISGSSSVLSIFVKDVSFAMETSIAGIAFSLIVSFLNTLFPINTIRNAISTELENCLEYLWYFVHGGRSERQQVDAFSDMIVLLENIDEKIEDPGSEVIKTNRGLQADAFSKMIKLLENMEQKSNAANENKNDKSDQAYSRMLNLLENIERKTTKTDTDSINSNLGQQTEVFSKVVKLLENIEHKIDKPVVLQDLPQPASEATPIKQHANKVLTKVSKVKPKASKTASKTNKSGKTDSKLRKVG